MEICAGDCSSVVRRRPQKRRLCVKIKIPTVLFLRQLMCFVACSEASFPEFPNNPLLSCYVLRLKKMSMKAKHVLVNVCVYVCTQSCLTLYDSMDYSSPVSSVLEIFQIRILEWVGISDSRRSS